MATRRKVTRGRSSVSLDDLDLTNLDFGQRLRALCDAKGLKYSVVGGLVGISESYMSQLLAGREVTTLRLVLAFAEFFEVRPARLMEGLPEFETHLAQLKRADRVVDEIFVLDAVVRRESVTADEGRVLGRDHCDTHLAYGRYGGLCRHLLQGAEVVERIGRRRLVMDIATLGMAADIAGLVAEIAAIGELPELAWEAMGHCVRIASNMRDRTRGPDRFRVVAERFFEGNRLADAERAAVHGISLILPETQRWDELLLLGQLSLLRGQAARRRGAADVAVQAFAEVESILDRARSEVEASRDTRRHLLAVQVAVEREDAAEATQRLTAGLHPQLPLTPDLGVRLHIEAARVQGLRGEVTGMALHLCLIGTFGWSVASTQWLFAEAVAQVMMSGDEAQHVMGLAVRLGLAPKEVSAPAPRVQGPTSQRP